MARVEDPESAPGERLADREARQGGAGGRPGLRRGYEMRRAAAQHEHAEGQRQIGEAPVRRLDQDDGNEGGGKRADADAGNGETGGHAPPCGEPSLDRADRRHIGQPHPEADAESVSEADLPERGRMGGDKQAGSDHGHAGNAQLPRPHDVGDPARDRAEAEIEKRRQRKDQARLGARRAELPLERGKEGREGVGSSETDEQDDEGRPDDAPAVSHAAVGPIPATVVRCITRRYFPLFQGRPRCRQQRLSHMTRSPCRQRWV